MIRQAWIGLMALIAVLATGAQLDRQSRRDAAIAPLVPTPFRSFAQERLTIETVRSDDPAKALATARQLVQRRPVPSEHLSLLAIAVERNDDTATSGLLVQKAARRGWRDSIAQQAMFDLALTAGDVTEASRRLAAMWALREDQLPVLDLTKRLLATPQGQAAMAETLTTGGRWDRAFLAAGPELPPRAFAETISQAVRNGARLDCKVLKYLSNAYAAKHLESEVAMITKASQTCQR